MVNNEGASAMGSFDVERETSSGEGSCDKQSCGLGGPPILAGDVAESDSLSSVGVHGDRKSVV